MISSVAYSLGYGSGIDVAKLVTDLAAASRDPKVARFDARTQAVQTSISSVARARADLEGFSTSLATLVAGGTLQSQPSVADPSILDAKATVGARLAGFSGEIEVTQLARGQALASGFVAAASDPVGQGTLTLTVGSTPFAIAIGAANDSLTGLAAAINDARSGVTASVVTDTAGARLVLKGASGAPSAFTLSSNDPGLAGFAYPGSMTLVQAAQNSAFTVDGLAYSRPSNVVADVVPGVSLTLKKVAIGTPVTIGVTRAGDTLKTTLTDFVSVFNELKASIATARTATRGDQAMRTLDRQMAQLVSQAVTSGTPASLSAIGVKTNRDGTIMFDEAAFGAAYARDPDAVEAIFSPTRDATHTALTDPGIGGALAALKTAATATNGALAGLTSRLGKEASALASDRARMEARETAYKARLEAQFGNVDSRVGALKATQSYLDQQIKVWTRSND
jgi:flagellar hook-associated protein 2